MDRARSGSKHHLLVEASGIPLAVSLTGGHRNDITQLIPLIDAVRPVGGRIGRPRKRALLSLPWVSYVRDRPGRGGQRPPRVSIARAISASAE